MAQTTEYWQNKILEQIADEPVLAAMNSTSAVAIYNLFAFVVATCINLFEQTMDIFKEEIETIAAEATPNTPAWIQDQVFRFQYSSTSPQIAQLIDFAVAYPVVDETLRIITRCSVETNANREVNIKVAKNDPPVPLAVLEQAALQSYVNAFNAAGIYINLINLDSDKLQVFGNIYYNGQYSATIQTNVEAAIAAYLESLPFNGKIKLSQIEDAIQSVIGVTDVAITSVKARRNTIAAASAGAFARVYQTYSGYIVPETTASYTLADTLTYIVEN